MWERQTPKGTGLQSFGCSVQGLWKERTLWKGVPKETFHTLTRSSTSFHQHCRGGGWWTPSTLMMRDSQYTHIWSVSLTVNKHLIKFPIALDYLTLRGRSKMEYSTGSTVHVWLFHHVAQGRHRGWCKLEQKKHLINSLVKPRCCNWLVSGWKTMEIQQWKC